MEPEAVSLLGKPLPRLIPAEPERLEELLREAERNYDPSDPDRIVWLARRQGYLGRYRDAIDTLTRGVELHPNEPKLYRHRGHRWISLRRFDRAVSDLTRAAELIRGRPDEVEPDGAPNRFNTPTSTLNSNVWYHLGLAHYLRREFSRARECYAECQNFATCSDDMLVATLHWRYMTLRRLNLPEEARRLVDAARGEMRILENGAYHALVQMYRGARTPESVLQDSEAGMERASAEYGVGAWHFYHGRHIEAFRIFESIVQRPGWSHFGYIAAEAELYARNG
jgi:tetratricopeptide (TPR) repeat protein